MRLFDSQPPCIDSNPPSSIMIQCLVSKFFLYISIVGDCTTVVKLVALLFIYYILKPNIYYFQLQCKKTSIDQVGSKIVCTLQLQVSIWSNPVDGSVWSKLGHSDKLHMAIIETFW